MLQDTGTTAFPRVTIYWVNISKISPRSHMGLCIAEKEDLNLFTNSHVSPHPVRVKFKIMVYK